MNTWNHSDPLWRRIVFLRPFNQAQDAFTSTNPLLTTVAAIASAIGLALCMAGMTLLVMESAAGRLTMLSGLSVYAVSLGLLWHGGWKGRAKNGIVLMMFMGLVGYCWSGAIY